MPNPTARAQPTLYRSRRFLSNSRSRYPNLFFLKDFQETGQARFELDYERLAVYLGMNYARTGAYRWEINRVLKPNGKFYIFRTPRRQSYAEHLAKFLGMGSHEILMDENEVMNQLEDNGFTVLSAKRTDMIIEYIPGLLPVLNLLSPILLIVDSILLMTPLSFFAHHMQIISLKTSK